MVSNKFVSRYNYIYLEDFRYMKIHIFGLEVGLLAQLVEHCTGIAEVMGSNPVRA